jgi:hypothetical protein
MHWTSQKAASKLNVAPLRTSTTPFEFANFRMSIRSFG